MVRVQVKNLTGENIILKEGNAGIYRLVQTIGIDGSFSVNIDENATYREFVCVETKGLTVTLTSDDCIDYSEFRIRYNNADKSELIFESTPRNSRGIAHATTDANIGRAVKGAFSRLIGLFRKRSAPSPPGTSAAPAPGTSAPPPPATSAPPAPGTSAPPPPGTSAAPPPGISAAPAPGTSAAPAPGTSAAPAPGTSAAPAPGTSAAPAPGTSAAPAPGTSAPPPPGTSAPPPPGTSQASVMPLPFDHHKSVTGSSNMDLP